MHNRNILFIFATYSIWKCAQRYEKGVKITNF
uniref:Uncharacterized protein n=1 Tax=Myoviridae sp. ctLEM34 TaxID=2825082 RepID=A0A8S5TR62_9CAUD|nr:MAG TPA: hypothetical protein [Myoviridae sp. ctLEM34]DAV55198.1 MAG TPA: hypothetical protein [Caudoviricetes sp.]